MPLSHSQRRIFAEFFCLLSLAGQAMTLPSSRYTQIHAIPSPKFLNQRESVQVIHTVESISSDSMLLACCTSSFVPTTFQDGSPAIRVVKTCNVVANMNGGCTPQVFPPADDTSDGPPSDSLPLTGSSTIPSSSGVSASLPTSSPLSSTSDTSLSFSTVSTTPASSSAPAPTSFSNTPSPPSSTLVTTTLIPASSTSSPGTSETPSLSPSPGPAPNSSVIRTSNSTSSTLPKVIGAFAGVSVILLIIGGTIGYLKQKKMKKGNEPILWPDTLH